MTNLVSCARKRSLGSNELVQSLEGDVQLTRPLEFGKIGDQHVRCGQLLAERFLRKTSMAVSGGGENWPRWRHSGEHGLARNGEKSRPVVKQLV